MMDWDAERAMFKADLARTEARIAELDRRGLYLLLFAGYAIATMACLLAALAAMSFLATVLAALVSGLFRFKGVPLWEQAKLQWAQEDWRHEAEERQVIQGGLE